MLSLLTFIVMVFASVGAFCATKSSVRGNVTMKISQTVAQINLGESDLKVGQRLAVFRACQGGRFSVCNGDRVGSAQVTKIFNKKYSEVTMDKDVYFEEGYRVEKDN
ncbi:hypothetical protein D3C87_301160 [compost metagenome]